MLVSLMMVGVAQLGRTAAWRDFGLESIEFPGPRPVNKLAISPLAMDSESSAWLQR